MACSPAFTIETFLKTDFPARPLSSIAAFTTISCYCASSTVNPLPLLPFTKMGMPELWMLQLKAVVNRKWLRKTTGQKVTAFTE